MPLPRSIGFDTLSGHLPVFPDYLATDCMFIDWELIKWGPPLIPPSLALQKVRLPLMWKRYIVGQHKRMCCNVSFASSHLFALCVQYTVRLWFSLWLLLSLFGVNWRCKKKNKWCQLLTLPAGSLGDFILLSVTLTSDSMYLCISVCFYVFMCRAVTVQPVIFGSVYLLASVSSPLSLFLYCLSPWQSIWWFHPLPADCLLSPVLSSFSHCCLPCPFPRHRPPCLIFCLLPLVSLSPPPTPLNSTEPAVVSNHNKCFKNSVNIAPYKQQGPPCWLFMYSGVHCIMVEMLSEPNVAVPSKCDVFIHSH